MNRVEISGRVTREPEVRYVGNTRFPILGLNVAVDNGTGRWNSETRKTEYESGFYQVEVVGQYGEMVADMVKRGDEVYVVGSLSQFTTQPKGEGESKTHTRIKATLVQPLTGVRGPAPQRDRIAPPDEPPVDPWELPADGGRF